MRNITAVMLLAPLAGILGTTGCSFVGPEAVRNGRPDYNDAIHYTAKQQALLNIVRVHFNDTTFFMDISEVDASLQYQGNASAGVSLPQAFAKSSLNTAGNGATWYAGHDYNIGGGVQYMESPTIRFQPLSGAALIAQVSTPITADSLASLYDSDWPIGPLLDLAVDRICTHAKDNFPALNALMELDSYQAIVLASVKSNLSISAGTSTVLQAGGAAPSNDALSVYFEPEKLKPRHDENQNDDAALQAAGKLWARLLRIYEGTQEYEDLNQPTKISLTDVLASLEGGKFDPRRDRFPRRIELRTAPVPMDHSNPKLSDIYDYAPLMRTHSALGILRSAALEDPRIEFIQAKDLKTAPWCQKKDCDQLRGLYFYTVKPSSTAPGGQEIQLATHASEKALFTQDLMLKLDPNDPIYEKERTLAHSRRYMLVIQDDNPPPPTAYVSTKKDVVMIENGQTVKKTQYFYIDGSDYVSQTNFALFVEFLTIQAIPSTTPPLTPSLTVGGKS